MGDFSKAHNELVDAHFELEEELKQLKLKVAEQEDRARRNNIKFCSIPENVKNADLKQFLRQMTSDLLPSTSQQELIIDRAHRLPKPSYISESLPHDVIARIHYSHIKDQLMQFACQNFPLPDPYATIVLFSDLSHATIMACRNPNSITKILGNHKIIYKWIFSTKLMIDRNNTFYTIYLIDYGLNRY